ncbi:transcriptional adapter 2-beta isoform X2 [Phacochoerus africanus]|uniref:transcriptional adapter 2-beta isoform X2 n=1 Tax=Phacochoerus africanus TaxID=41426 RepID=UPI001FD8B3D6|nr:transcriptional adapter 2-beta isoform X2 [Phacochoerus africanus]
MNAGASWEGIVTHLVLTVTCKEETVQPSPPPRGRVKCQLLPFSLPGAQRPPGSGPALLLCSGPLSPTLRRPPGGKRPPRSPAKPGLVTLPRILPSPQCPACQHVQPEGTGWVPVWPSKGAETTPISVRGRHGCSRGRFPDPPGSDGALHISVAEQQQLGYMPLRDDYEIEYDQDAETLISGLSVNYDDDDVEIELKRAHVDMYVRKLKERQRRKNIARDYNLVPAFLGKDKKEKEKAAKRKVTKEEKELRLKLRPLYQFMSCKEFDDLFENMHKEKMLRAKIRELQRYRRNGITKMEESAEYEAARHKREKRKENRSTGGSKRGKEDGKDGEFAAIEHLPGFELLSDREKVLCSSLNLSPARYVTVKTIIIKDHLQKRQGVPAKSRLPGYLDKVLKKRILNFLTESGWISRDAS